MKNKNIIKKINKNKLKNPRPNKRLKEYIEKGVK